MCAGNGLIQVTGGLEILVCIFGTFDVNGIGGESNTTKTQDNDAYIYTAHSETTPSNNNNWEHEELITHTYPGQPGYR